MQRRTDQARGGIRRHSRGGGTEPDFAKSVVHDVLAEEDRELEYDALMAVARSRLHQELAFDQLENVIRRFAGVFVLLSLALGYWVHPAWYLFTAFVGVNLSSRT